MNSSLSYESLKPNLLPLVALLVVGTTLPLVIMPWFNDVTSQWAKISTQTDLRNKVTVKADRLEKFSGKELAASKSLLQDTVEPAIPATEDPSGVLGTLEQVAQAAGITIEGVTYANSPAQPGLPAVGVAGDMVKVTFSVEGAYENIVSFIANSEKIARVVAFNSFQMTKNDETSSVVTASFEVNSPYLAHPTDLGPIEEAFPELGSKETAVVNKLKQFSQATYSPTDVSTITGKTNPF